MDAAECPPTFGVSKDLVIALIAGGEKAVASPAEDAEDDVRAGAADLLSYQPGENDVVVGISASGRAPYVVGALQKARLCGCVTVGISNNPKSAIEKIVDVSICLDTGPEVLTGSTRMKAATAQKIVLNMLSTCSMVKTGKVYQNFMINLKPSNKKLRSRMINIVSELTGLDRANGGEKAGGTCLGDQERFRGGTEMYLIADGRRSPFHIVTGAKRPRSGHFAASELQKYILKHRCLRAVFFR